MVERVISLFGIRTQRRITGNFLRLAYTSRIIGPLAVTLIYPLSSSSVVQISVQTIGTKHFSDFL